MYLIGSSSGDVGGEVGVGTVPTGFSCWSTAFADNKKLIGRMTSTPSASGNIVAMEPLPVAESENSRTSLHVLLSVREPPAVSKSTTSPVRLSDQWSNGGPAEGPAVSPGPCQLVARLCLYRRLCRIELLLLAVQQGGRRSAASFWFVSDCGKVVS